MTGESVPVSECRRVHDALDDRLARMEKLFLDMLRALQTENKADFESVFSRLTMLSDKIQSGIEAEKKIEKHIEGHWKSATIVVSIVLALLSIATTVIIRSVS